MALIRVLGHGPFACNTFLVAWKAIFQAWLCMRFNNI